MYCGCGWSLNVFVQSILPETLLTLYLEMYVKVTDFEQTYCTDAFWDRD